MGLKLHLSLIVLLSALAIILMQGIQTIPKPKIAEAPSYKENLILVHSFPTNSILLHGLIEYLKEDFNVYFIDLPGFTRGNPALEEFSIDSDVKFLEQKIADLNLDNYFIGGISFGFMIVNRANLNSENCKAILAIEPYINRSYLNMGFVKSFLYSHLLDSLSEHEGWVEKFWKNSYADEVLSFFSGQSENISRVVLSEIDDKTFLSTAKYLVENNDPVIFKKDIPYVLIINKNDQTVNAEPTISLFEQNVPEGNFLAVYTDIEHYPKTLTREYFRAKLDPSKITEIVSWIKDRSISNF